MYLLTIRQMFLLSLQQLQNYPLYLTVCLPQEHLCEGTFQGSFPMSFNLINYRNLCICHVVDRTCDLTFCIVSGCGTAVGVIIVLCFIKIIIIYDFRPFPTVHDQTIGRNRVCIISVEIRIHQWVFIFNTNVV